MKLSLDDISRFLFSYNNLWPNEAHPPDFRIFPFFLADVSWPPVSLFLESPHLSLPYLYFLTSHSRDPLTFAIYSALFFFFSSIDFSDFSQTKRSVSNLAIPRGFIYSCPSFTSHSITIRWRFTTSVRTKPFERYPVSPVVFPSSLAPRFLCIIPHANFHYNFHPSTLEKLSSTVHRTITSLDFDTRIILFISR